LNAIAWGRLLRLSLAPSAAADALAGITIGAWGAFPLDPRAALLPVASLCVFHGGMALNDWADREGDARTRPERPIPSGAVPAAKARFAAVALLALGPAFANVVTPLAGACLAGVALTAALYDLAGRGPWLGPTLLGLCRGGNLASGVLAGAALSELNVARIPHWAWLACALYALYVFCASRLARLEDDEDARELDSRPAFALLSAAACLAILPWTALLDLGPAAPAPVLSATEGHAMAGSAVVLLLVPGVLMGLVSAGLLAAEARAIEPWTRARVGRAAGMTLRRLLVFSSICAWCAPIAHLLQAGARPDAETFRGMALAPLLLLGYPIALRLRRVFPPT
jgi:4-hydroxybenzoate polyprenyltransferase